MSENISELVWLYIKRRPILKASIKENIVNFSSLARKISIELFGNTKKVNAIKMALVRHSKKLFQIQENLEDQILNVLTKSSLTIKTKVSVLISSREIPSLKYLSYVESSGTITYIVEDNELEKIKKSKFSLNTETTLNLIVVHSPPSIEETPGVISYLIDSLSSEGINIVEFVSCYTDTLLVIRQADTSRAQEILNNLMI
jgi:arginine repressor